MGKCCDNIQFTSVFFVTIISMIIIYYYYHEQYSHLYYLLQSNKMLDELLFIINTKFYENQRQYHF